MDFRQNLQQAMNNRTEPAGSEPAAKGGKKAHGVAPSWLAILNAVVLVGAVLLIIASIFAFTQIGKNTRVESKYVDTSLYQAVFLNNGQVYFGNVTALNSQYVTLESVYYLTQATNAQGQASSDYTLVKLGCQQIHYPTDRMVINRDQVTFWENLSKDGKVAKSIADYKKQYPNGNCSEATSTQTQSSTNSATQTQNAATSNTNNATTTR